jgi:hypothetical protein
MTSIKTLLAAALVAASSTLAFAGEGNVSLYPSQAGANAIIEGRNVALAPAASTEVNVSLYDQRMQDQVLPGGINAVTMATTGTEVGVSR